MSIILHQFAPIFGLPNPSPFCIKLEAYLRIAGMAYTVQTIQGRIKSPTGKAPYIELDGKTMADSGLIIEHLERVNGHPVNGKLTLAERAQSLAFQRLMEEHLYAVVGFARWLDPAHPVETSSYAQSVIGLKGLIGKIITRVVQRDVMKSIRAQGLGRHAPEILWQFGITDVQALAHWLGNRPWGFGDKPTVFDAVLFAFIASIIYTPWDCPLKIVTLKNRNLVDHTERMLRTYFPEYAETLLTPAAAS